MTPKVCLVGQVLVDVTFLGEGEEPKLRLGGIAHASRALWSIDCPYVLAYIAPEYLDDQIVQFAGKHGNPTVQKFGNVLGCPNVVTVGEPTEAGSQGYEYLLRDEQRSVLNLKALMHICEDPSISDILVFPGGFEIAPVLEILGKSKANIHIDANFQPQDLNELGLLQRKFATVMLSTSSTTFLQCYSGSAAKLTDSVLPRYADALLLKENRGGSRYFPATKVDHPVAIPAQVRKIVHSIGVGDCFDAILVALRHKLNLEPALAYASCIAAEYATTTFPDDFKSATQATLKFSPDEVVQLKGVVLHWEDRPTVHIYIASPDFDYVDRRPLDRLVSCLKYHNFTPRRPVLENGQMKPTDDFSRKQALCDADVQLISKCQIMVAVMLYDDPGTLIEIGMAVERKMPVIVYDPYKRAENLMLTQMPNLISDNLDEVVAAVFQVASGSKNGTK